MSGNGSVGQANRSTALRFLWKQFAAQGRWFVVSTASSLVVAAAAMVAPMITAQVIDQALPAGNVGLLLWLCIVGCSLNLVGAAASYAQVLAAGKAGLEIIRQTRAEFYRGLLQRDMSFFDRQPAGQAIERVTEDANMVGDAVGGTYSMLTHDFLIACGVMAGMLSLSPYLALMCLAFLLPAALVLRMVGRILNSIYCSLREVVGNLTTLMEETLAGVLVVQAFGQEKDRTRAAQVAAGQAVSLRMRAARVQATVHPLIEFTADIGFCLLLVVGAIGISAGWTTTGVLVAFLAYFTRLQGAVRNIGSGLAPLIAGLVGASRPFLHW